MVVNKIESQLTLQKDITFYHERFPQLLFGLGVAIVILFFLSLIILYQVLHRPLPVFYAKTPAGEQFELMPHADANLLPLTILHWASKAAVAAYTFSFDPIFAAQQAALTQPYFTRAGWQAYQASTQDLMKDIIQKQLFVNGVVSGTPLIVGQGDVGDGYTWHLQIPFLVTYQGSEGVQLNYYLILMDVVKIPPNQNPIGIGINRFIMTSLR